MGGGSSCGACRKIVDESLTREHRESGARRAISPVFTVVPRPSGASASFALDARPGLSSPQRPMSRFALVAPLLLAAPLSAQNTPAPRPPAAISAIRQSDLERDLSLLGGDAQRC